MSSLPPIRKLYMEDYPSQKGWIGPFLLTLNSFMTTVVSSLNKSLTLVDNTTSDIKYITLTNVPTSSNPASIAWSKSITPIAVLVGKVKLNSANTTLSSAVQVDWQMSTSNTSLQITNVTGITPSSSNQYTLTLVCIAG